MKKGIITVRIEEMEATANSLVNTRGEDEAKAVLKNNMLIILDDYGILADSNVTIDVRFEEEK